MSEVTYTAVATSTAEGRNGGRASSDDGALDVALAVPKELGGAGGATNPEQLFAAGWASCFVGAVRRVAAEKKVRPTDLAVVAEITLHHDTVASEFKLSAVLRLTASGIDQATAEQLVDGAHQVCPYSKATRGNIEVALHATAV
ncbi:organic hydroperoxide resistance protein [Saccharothrix luteola]|uniref:organic hydroperoxide resistance protein n=1 Tax=Saccharothrix luteola TaxID=2893018 RepID=UPI001E542E23|nr:organic hydroperoxide resistance protein [Saccharothrix luteola]MCC8249305.1 organic hydroperoxide resistance protein [Saccharothrix luteola]